MNDQDDVRAAKLGAARARMVARIEARTQALRSSLLRLLEAPRPAPPPPGAAP